MKRFSSAMACLVVLATLGGCSHYSQARNTAIAGLVMFTTATAVAVTLPMASDEPIPFEVGITLGGAAFTGIVMSTGALIEATNMLQVQKEYIRPVRSPRPQVSPQSWNWDFTFIPSQNEDPFQECMNACARGMRSQWQCTTYCNTVTVNPVLNMP